MATIWQDIRYGFRMLARKPGFTSLAMLTLSLGIGANTAIFSIIDAVLLRPLPYRKPAQLVQLWQTESAPGSFPLTGQDYLDWRAQNHTFEDMAVYSFQESFNASGSGEPERVTGVETQANFFSVLGVQPVLGRPFLQGDYQAWQNHEALLSYGFWKRHFAGQSAVLGSSIELNGEPYKVVGVMPSWYRIPAGADLWVPIDMTPKALGERGSHHLRALGRVKDGLTIDQARADLLTISTNLEKQYPDSNGKVHSVVVSLGKQIIGDSRTQLWVIFGAVALVLLIASANVANLLLARATDRRREVAMRAALGAERLRLVRQLLTESVLLALLGTLPGVALAYVGVSLLANVQQLPFPQPNPIAVNPMVLAFTLVISIAIGILFGLAPAIETSQINLIDELKSGGKLAHTASRRSRLVRNALVAAEIALSLALLAGAAILLRTFENLRAVNLGVNAEQVLTGALLLPAKEYPTPEKTRGFCERLVELLAAAPGVRAAALTTELPLLGGNNGYVTIDGQDDKASEGQLVEWTSVTPDYFHAMGIPLMRGRGFTRADMDDVAAGIRKLLAAQPNSQGQNLSLNLQAVAVINQAMARRFWPNQDATGKIFRTNGIPVKVIGVAGDTKVFGLRQPPLPQAYLPLTWRMDRGGGPFNIVIQTAGRPQNMAAAIRRAVQSLDRNLAVYHLQTMTEIAADPMTNDSEQTFLLATFAGLAVILAAVGTYGVMSYLVTQRTSEIGIRMALGAGRGAVLWMVLREGLMLAILGIGIGLAGAFATSQLLQSSLFGVKPNDPWTLAAASMVMAVVAMVACLIPATRAMRVEPITALRHE
ncbi:MAG: ABC transporter permease [Acidobacteriota bacterium]|jgi:putative ABC transport system permease protein